MLPKWRDATIKVTLRDTDGRVNRSNIHLRGILEKDNGENQYCK